MSSEMANIRFRTDSSTIAWLSYGAYPDCDKFLTISRINKEHSINLNGLLSDITHCYKIYLTVDGSTLAYKADEGFFRTFKDEKGTFFSFIAFGDSGSNSEEQKKIAQLMEKKENIDFVIHTGDLVDSGKDEDATSQYFGMYKNLLKRVPFFIALGNHDYGREFNKEEGRGFLKENYKPYHSWPMTGYGPHYYYFDIANARFIILDANNFYGAIVAPSLKKGSQQYKWLEDVLKLTNKTWKFIVIHEPIYSSGEHGVIEEEREILAPLFEKYKVDIVFHGHDHNYERTKPILNGVEDEKGVIYITLGGGGRKLYSQKEENDWSEVFILKHHFAHISVEDKKLEMKVYDLNNEIIDSLILQK